MNTTNKANSEAKHTPGPWRLNGSQITARANWRLPVCVVVSKEAVRPTVDAAAKTLAEARANARLIAAAPEFSALLRDGAMQLERLEGENLRVYARTFAALASAAIARATAQP